MRIILVTLLMILKIQFNYMQNNEAEMGNNSNYKQTTFEYQRIYNRNKANIKLNHFVFLFKVINYWMKTLFFFPKQSVIKWSSITLMEKGVNFKWYILFIIFFSDVIPPAMLRIKPTTSVAIFLMPACFDSF